MRKIKFHDNIILNDLDLGAIYEERVVVGVVVHHSCTPRVTSKS